MLAFSLAVMWGMPWAQYFKSDLTGLSWSDWIKSRSDLKTGYFNTDPDNPDPEDQDSALVIQSFESRLKFITLNLKC